VEIVFGSDCDQSSGGTLVADATGCISAAKALNCGVILSCSARMLLIRGATESAKAMRHGHDQAGILAMFILIAVTGFSTQNLKPFAPHGSPG